MCIVEACLPQNLFPSSCPDPTHSLWGPAVLVLPPIIWFWLDGRLNLGGCWCCGRSYPAAGSAPRPAWPSFVFGRAIGMVYLTSCAIRGARGGDIGHRSPPGSSEELGWTGWMGVVRGSNLDSGPLGSVAGDPDRHRGWLLCPSSVPAAAGRGLRPRVFSAPRPDPQLQVHARPGTGCNSPARPLAMRLQTGPTPLLQAIFTVWPDLVPIQTGAPAQIRAADRSSGTPAVLPA
jgi:hypothetical protein